MLVPGHYNAVKADQGGDAFYNLLPALLQCFAIIICGYLSGRVGLISQSNGQGLAVFVSKFAMPAMLFKSMCELHFDMVDWTFLAAILVGKSTIFILVLFTTALLIRPLNLGKMGIYSIFSTQSHDFALGIPIVQALYSSSHPDFEKYLYLIAPISVAFLNPIGFVLMAAQNWKSSEPDERKSKIRAALEVIFQVIRNPVVTMTILGIVCNFIFHQKVPSYLDKILDVLKSAFPGTALFCLGLSMVGKISSQKDRSFVVLFLLIAAKMVISPLLIRELVSVFCTRSNETELADLSGYGFLYGMFPTAPSVFIYANSYSAQPDLMATGMVVSTFVAAPLMFVSGKMLMMPISQSMDWLSLIHKASFDVGIISLFCVVWVLVVFYINRRIRNLPHQFTAFLGISQVVMSVGIILLECISGSAIWQHCLQFVVFYTGLLSTRCWMAMLAFSLCVLKVRSFCALYNLRPFIFFYAIGIPVIVSGVLLASTPQSRLENTDPSFLNGSTQRIVMLCALSINIVVALLAMIRSHRYELMHLMPTRSSKSSTSTEPDVYPNTPALLINGSGSFLTPGPNNRYTSPVTICQSAPSRFACYNPKNCKTRIPSPMLGLLAGRQRQDEDAEKTRSDDSDEDQLQQRRRKRQDSDDYNIHKLALGNTMRKRQDTEDLAKLVERWGLDGSRQDHDDNYLKPGNFNINRQVNEDSERRGMGKRIDSEDIIGRGMRDSRDNSEIDFMKFLQDDAAVEERVLPDVQEIAEPEKEDLRAKRLRRRAAQNDVQIEEKAVEKDEDVIDKKFYIGNKPIESSDMDAKRKRRRAGKDIITDKPEDHNQVLVTVDIEDLGEEAPKEIETRRRRRQTAPGGANASKGCGNLTGCHDCGDCEQPNQTATKSARKSSKTILPDVTINCHGGREDLSDSEETPLLLGNGSISRAESMARAETDCPAAGTSLCESQERCLVAQTFRDNNDVSSEDELLMLQDQDLIQHTRHLILVLLLLVSAFVSFCLNMWTLMNEKTNSVYVEVEFLDSVLTYGQGFFVFAVFGVDTRLIVEPLTKRWREWFTGRQEITLPSWHELDETTQRTCEQFIVYHLVQCRQLIVSDRRERLKLYRSVFLGTHLVDWLIEVGLATDRADAVTYGQRLLMGQVIEHILRKHHFQDLPYFYRFVQEVPNKSDYEQLP